MKRRAFLQLMAAAIAAPVLPSMSEPEAELVFTEFMKAKHGIVIKDLGRTLVTDARKNVFNAHRWWLYRDVPKGRFEYWLEMDGGFLDLLSPEQQEGSVQRELQHAIDHILEQTA